MASQVLSGATNASYTNNTGQNVRLIINYMSNVTSMTWAGVTVTASSTTIGKDIQNITGELRGAVPGNQVSQTGTQTVNEAEISTTKASLVTTDANNLTAFFPYGGANNFNITPTGAGSGYTQNEWSANLFYVPLTISRGGNFPVELMLANGQSFSSICGAYNAIVIKEDGT